MLLGLCTVETGMQQNIALVPGQLPHSLLHGNDLTP